MSRFPISPSHLRHGALLSLTVFGLLIGAKDALAYCGANPAYPTKDILMQVGKVVIRPTDPVGTVYPAGPSGAGWEFPASASTTIKPFVCDMAVGGALKGSILKGVADGDGWVQTNVPGIAMQMYRNRGGVTVETRYPHTIVFPPGYDVGFFESNLKFGLRLKKIAPATGSGPLSEGQYSQYTGDDPSSRRSVLNTYVFGEAITIVTPTCEVDHPSRNLTVPLGQQPKNLFTGVNSVSPAVPFQIRLKCNAGLGEPRRNKIYLRMEAKEPVAGQPGVMKLAREDNAATGIGIQIRDWNSQPVEFNGEGTYVGETADRNFDLRYTARYYQTGAAVTAGKGNGTATFTIEYD
ncbi:fimbrial protein [Variovorax sp. DAIF25]|uniref:fimbrial protein n=1 Tax=Variovorax sp. DAIF25 TaxID=3080983 RepID=UPI003D6C299C